MAITAQKPQVSLQRLQNQPVLQPKVRYTQEQKELILRAYHERASLRALERLCGVSRRPIRWIKKSRQFTRGERHFVSPQEADVLEWDEMWSFVGRRAKKLVMECSLSPNEAGRRAPHFPVQLW